MEAVFYTNKGHERHSNEDTLFVGGCSVCHVDMNMPSYIRTDSDNEVFCVIDGMGGYVGGAAAARIAAQTFQSVPLESDNRFWLKAVLQKTSEEIREMIRCSSGLYYMGATLAGAVINKSKKSIFAFNVGDCRVYRLRDGFLEKLTHDHSRVQELFDNGEISEDAMRIHPNKNIVTASVTANEFSAKLYCEEFSINSEDRFFICSDGVWESLPIKLIEKKLSDDDIHTACSKLHKSLISSECRDNVSFIVV